MSISLPNMWFALPDSMTNDGFTSGGGSGQIIAGEIDVAIDMGTDTISDAVAELATAQAVQAFAGYKEKIEFNYDPIDLIPDKAVGILLPLNKAVNGTALIGNPTNPVNAGALYSTRTSGGGVFRLSYTTEEQGISNLRMLLLTRKGERLYHPTFGTNLQELVFEPNTEELDDQIVDALTESINLWLPYIVINNINVNNTDEFGDPRHTIEIQLKFQVTEQGANQVIILIVTGGTINIIQ